MAIATPPAVRVLERYVIEARRTWLSQLSGTALVPLLYLAAMGLGLGVTIDQGGRTAVLGGVSYAAFLAPGLLASTAMQTGAMEAAWPVMTGFKWSEHFVSAANTELDPADLFNGMVLWTTVKLMVSSCTFLLIMMLFGLVRSPWAIAAVPVAVLCGLAFTALLGAWSATMHDEGQKLSLTFRMVIMPLFLFSGAFFPVSQLPAAVRWLAYLTPTWHGVEACRMLVLGRVEPGRLALNVGFLMACVVVGGLVGHRTFRIRIRGKG